MTWLAVYVYRKLPMIHSVAADAYIYIYLCVCVCACVCYKRVRSGVDDEARPIGVDFSILSNASNSLPLLGLIIPVKAELPRSEQRDFDDRID